MLEAAVFLLLVAVIELAEELEPVLLAVRNLIENFFHLRGEADVDVVAEVIAQQSRHGKRGKARDQGLPLARHVTTALDRRDRRGIRRRTADALLFEPLDERRLGKAGWRAGLMSLG